MYGACKGLGAFYYEAKICHWNISDLSLLESSYKQLKNIPKVHKKFNAHVIIKETPQISLSTQKCYFTLVDTLVVPNKIISIWNCTLWKYWGRKNFINLVARAYLNLLHWFFYLKRSSIESSNEIYEFIGLWQWTTCICWTCP